MKINLSHVGMWMYLGSKSRILRVPRPVKVIREHVEPINIVRQRFDIYMCEVGVVMGKNTCEAVAMSQSISQLFQQYHLVGSVKSTVNNVIRVVHGSAYPRDDRHDLEMQAIPSLHPALGNRTV